MRRLLARLKLLFKNIKAIIFHKVSAEEIDLLRMIHFFDHLDTTAFNDLIKSVTIKNYLDNDLIYKEGTQGEAFYIVKAGLVRIFTHNNLNQKVVLAQLEGNSFFGEQDLLDETIRPRNASAEAVTATTVIEIKWQYLKKALQENAPLKHQLITKGRKELLHKVIELIDIYRHFEDEIIAAENIVIFEKGETIFKINELSHSAYINLEGVVKISIPTNTTDKDTFLLRGHLFGEAGVIENAPRACTAIASEYTKALKIDASKFKKYYENNIYIHNLLNQINKSYSIHHKGLATQFYSKVGENNVITTTYILDQNRIIQATNSDNNVFLISEANAQPTKTYRYKSESVEIEIGVANNRIALVKCIGEWSDLKYVSAAILENELVSQELLFDFENRGVFKLKNLDDDEIVCVCMSVEKEKINRLIESGVKSFAEISKQTGCSTVCGSCRPRVLGMLGQNVWLSATISKHIVHNNKIASFVIEPKNATFNPFVPGEHIIIQSNINGNWVERSYTISDISADNKLCITIKKEDDGLFTSWLFNIDTSKLSIFSTQPQGNFKLSMEESTPIVCFAGGIGITPFITFAKSLMTMQQQRHMHLIYIAPSSTDFIFLEEFERIKTNMESFKLTLWNRNERGYLSDEMIGEIIQNATEPDVYICGPEGFEASIVKSLKNLNYREDKIYIEKFTYANPIKNAQSSDI